MWRRSSVFNVLGTLLALVSLSQEVMGGNDGVGIGTKPNVFIISIGLNDYSRIKFENKEGETLFFQFDHSESDAQSFTSSISRYARDWKANTGFGSLAVSVIDSVYQYELLGNEVTWNNIQAVIDSVSIKAKSNDYFFFLFSGLSLQTIEGTFFVPKIDSTVLKFKLNSETTSDQETIQKVKQVGFSLEKLAQRLELISAQNQLIVSEAGVSSTFAREMVSILRAKTPDLHRLRQRNRVIAVPSKIGRDPGPLADWIATMPFPTINLFDIFTPKGWVKVLNYFYQRDTYDYATFFLESQFFRQLDELMPTQNRGTETVSASSTTVKSEGIDHALVIGIDQFPKGWPTWQRLTNPLNDARAIATELETNYGMQTRLLANISTDSILQTLKLYKNILQPNDQLFIYVATHGDMDSTFFDDGFLVGYNTLSKEKDPNRTTYLSYAQLYWILNNLPCNHILLTLDVCYGGAFDKNLMREAKNREAVELTVADRKFLAENQNRVTRQLITSAMLKPVPDQDLVNSRHSPFAIRFWNALRLPKPYLMAQDIFSLVHENADPNPLYATFGKHEAGSEFVFIKREVK